MQNPLRTDWPVAGKGGRAGRRARQRGELLMVRTVAVVAVLLLLLGIPLWMKHERDKRADPPTAKANAVAPAARAAMAPASAAAPVAAPAASGIRSFVSVRKTRLGSR